MWPKGAVAPRHLPCPCSRDVLQLAAASFPTAKLPAVWHRMPARVYCAAIVPDTPIVVSSCINPSRVSCLVLFQAPSPLSDMLWQGKSTGPNTSKSLTYVPALGKSPSPIGNRRLR